MIIFTEEILNRKLDFLYSVSSGVATVIFVVEHTLKLRPELFDHIWLKAENKVFLGETLEWNYIRK